MTGKQKLPYGQWPSQISPQRTGGMLEFSETAWNEQGDLFWRERSSRQGSIQMAAAAGNEIYCISGEKNVGGGLFYGGGSFGANKNWVIFVDSKSQQLIKTPVAGGRSIKLSSGLISSASPTISPDNQSVLFVHSDGEQDAIYSLNLEADSHPHLLISDADFYNYPRWHPDGVQIAWISWHYPHMPWDSSSLWLGELTHAQGGESSLKSKSLVAGGQGISIIQPEFSPDGKWLAYVSDQSGWWQLHIYDLANGKERQLTDVPADHALPPWLQNRPSYGFSSDSQHIYFLRNQEGLGSLWRRDLEGDLETRINLDESYTWLDWFSISPQGDKIALVASASDQPPRLITADPSGKTSLIRKSTQDDLPRNLFSIPQPISWRLPKNGPVKGLFYPPHHPDCESMGAPPLLVMIHSGPTSQKFREFSPRTQFFTSRGYAVLEVNYRGSTGYGRTYRQALQGEWGVIDVDDCLNGALYVTEQGWADRDKMALMGSSSGGLTVYQILVKYPGVFQAGIALYGIVNHLDLLKNPPKFERFYSEWLIGPYPEQEKKYRERSPIFLADRIQDPIAVFQGGKDPIVPQDQADQIIQVLRENQIPHLYKLYPEEGHGFKAAENIADFYQQSLDFLSHHLLQDKGE